MTDLSINAIRADGRHRRDLGDLTPLTDSIRLVGLLHPVVVDPEGRLIAGGRRLEACRALGWSSVPTTVVDSLGSASLLLAAERDENTCRKDMNVSEKVALGRALEELEKPAARERQIDAGVSRGRGIASDDSPQAIAVGRVRERVADALGMSGQTYARAKQVVETAECDDLEPEQKARAQEALAQMDATGKVAPAFAKVNQAGYDTGNGHVNGAPDMPLNERQRNVAAANAKRIATIVNTLDGYMEGIPNIKVDQAIRVAEPEELKHWCTVLSRASKELSRLRRELHQEG